MTTLEHFAASLATLPEHSRIYARGVVDGLLARESTERHHLPAQIDSTLREPIKPGTTDRRHAESEEGRQSDPVRRTREN